MTSSTSSRDTPRLLRWEESENGRVAVYCLPDGPTERTCSAGAWLRLTGPSKPLTRDDRALLALAELEAEGVSCSPRGRRLDVSGLTWGQWRGAVASLVKRGLVKREPTGRAKGSPDAYRITDRGRAYLCSLPRDPRPSAQVQHRASTGGQHRSSTPLDEDLLSSEINETEEHQSSISAPGPGLAPAESAQVSTGPAQVGVLAGEPSAQVVEHRHVLVLAPEILARLDALIALVLRPEPAASPPVPTATARPASPGLCDCGKPMSPPRRKRDGSGWGLGCVDWSKDGDGCSTWVQCDEHGTPLAPRPTVVPNVPSTSRLDEEREARRASAREAGEPPRLDLSQLSLDDLKRARKASAPKVLDGGRKQA